MGIAKIIQIKYIIANEFEVDIMNKKAELLIVLTVLTILNGCDRTTPIEYFQWELSDEGVTIIGFTGETLNLNIPLQIQGIYVTRIGGEAFRDKQIITRVSIPESVIYIGEDAFRGNRIGNITIPDSVLSIGPRAFMNNWLTYVNISNSVTTIEEGTFAGNGLTSITIPDSVTHIGDWAFFRNQLNRVGIPNTVVHIGNASFEENHLPSVIIPNSVAHIGIRAFSGNQLSHVRISDGITYISEMAFMSNQIRFVTIPDSVISIGANAFAGNQLTGITIPDSVTQIGSFAFVGNNQLTRITIGNNVALVNNGGFPLRFGEFYQEQERKAGTYTLVGSRIRSWRFEPRISTNYYGHEE